MFFPDFGIQGPIIQPPVRLGGHQALGRHGHGQGASWGLGSNGRTPGIQHIIVNGSPGEHAVVKPAGTLYVRAEQLFRFREASLEDVKEAFGRRQAVVPGAQEFRFFFLILQCFEPGWVWGGSTACGMQNVAPHQIRVQAAGGGRFQHGQSIAGGSRDGLKGVFPDRKSQKRITQSQYGHQQCGGRLKPAADSARSLHPGKRGRAGNAAA